MVASKDGEVTTVPDFWIGDEAAQSRFQSLMIACVLHVLPQIYYLLGQQCAWPLE